MNELFTKYTINKILFKKLISFAVIISVFVSIIILMNIFGDTRNYSDSNNELTLNVNIDTTWNLLYSYILSPSNLNIAVFSFALLIFLGWILFIFKIYDNKRKASLIVCIVIAILFSIYLYYLRQLINFSPEITVNKNLFQNFSYYFFYFGFLEELFKLLPAFWLIWYMKYDAKPIDYHVFISVSSISFAFVENSFLYSQASCFFISDNMFNAIVMHLFYANFILFGYLYGLRSSKRKAYLFLILFFLSSSIMHGFQKQLMMSKDINMSSLINIFSLFQIVWFISFIYNVIEESEKVPFMRKISILNPQLQLFIVLIAILLIEYFYNYTQNNITSTNNALLFSILTGSMYFIFILFDKNELYILKNKIEKSFINNYNMRYEGKVGFIIKAMDKHDGIYEGDDPDDYVSGIVGKTIKLSIYTRNEITEKLFPNFGLIKNNIIISSQPNWYLLELEKKMKINEIEIKQLIIRPKDEYSKINKDEESFIAVYLLLENIEDYSNLEMKNMDFLGWAVVRGIE